MDATFTCADCGKTKPINKSGGSGYAVCENDAKVCYDCVAPRDAQFMTEHGRMVLYWDEKKITNWPGTLTFQPIAVHHGKHNIAGARVDVWFIGPDNKQWHGVNIGDNQILRCKRNKK